MKNQMTNARSALKRAREIATNVPYELHDLSDYMSIVANDTLVPDGLITCLMLVTFDLQKGECGFNGLNKAEANVVLKKIGLEVLAYLPHFPLIIDKVADAPFAAEFRQLFDECKMFGKALPPVGETASYGFSEIEPGLIDISTKDRAAVLAALYNASKPQGMGFMHFDPTPMTVGEAEQLLSQTNYFDYLKGRVMKLDFSDNHIRTGGYNRDNGVGAAERAIGSCPNIA